MAVAFDQRPDALWFDGQLVPTSDAKISVLTHGLHYASAVFEGERAYGGSIFECTQHSERLKRSANILDFEVPYSVAEIDAAKRLVIEKNAQKEAYVRAIAWRGSPASPWWCRWAALPHPAAITSRRRRTRSSRAPRRWAARRRTG